MSVLHEVLLHWTGIDTQQSRFYDFWSGIAPAIGTYFPIWVGLVVFVLRHNCHVRGCWRIITSPEPTTGFRACRKHHSQRHMHGIPHLPD